MAFKPTITTYTLEFDIKVSVGTAETSIRHKRNIKTNTDQFMFPIYVVPQTELVSEGFSRILKAGVG